MIFADLVVGREILYSDLSARGRVGEFGDRLLYCCYSLFTNLIRSFQYRLLNCIVLHTVGRHSLVLGFYWRLRAPISKKLPEEHCEKSPAGLVSNCR
jgi:hypothetical protein